jgi:hypothetical protein
MSETAAALAREARRLNCSTGRPPRGLKWKSPISFRAEVSSRRSTSPIGVGVVRNADTAVSEPTDAPFGRVCSTSPVRAGSFQN